jgi:sugar/nucleoside kinase (ribokinase family)
MIPDILIAGHIAKDITATGWRPGGGVFYAAAQAARLGLNVGAVTACSAEVSPPAVLPDVTWHVLPSETTTTFENVYEAGIRRQRLLATAALLSATDIPRRWSSVPLVLLTSLFHEIDDALPSTLAQSGTLVGLGAQGWLRRLEGDRVQPMSFEPSPDWLAGEVVFVSEEDVLDSERVAEWQARVPIVVLTRGYRGCTVWDASGRHELSAAPVDEVDPTGAGDVFAAAFLVRYSEGRDALTAARFAAAAAALAVQGDGIRAIAGRGEIESLVRGGRVKVA